MSYEILYRTNDEGAFDKKILFNSKSDLYSKKFAQTIFKKLHLEQRRIKCGCLPNSNLYFAPSERPNSKDEFFLRKYDRDLIHRDDCPFHNEYQKYIPINEKTGEIQYTSKIFEEPKESKSSNKPPRNIESNIQRYTYTAFCRDLISSSCIRAFNIKNKDNEIGSLENFTLDNFINSLKSVAHEKPIKGLGNIYDFCKKNKGYHFDYGFIENLTPINEDISDDKIIEFETFSIRKNDETKGYEYNTTKTRKTTAKRYKITRKNLQIFNNFIDGPYFYIAINYFGKFVRFFMIPITLVEKSNSAYISFVESNYERNYAECLLSQNIPFVKPISEKELYSIKKEKICKNGNRPILNSRPDFIEFEDDKICIVEVSGFTSRDYLNQLEDKEKEYIREIKANENVTYKRVNGKDLNIEKHIDIISIVSKFFYNHSDFKYDNTWMGVQQIKIKEKTYKFNELGNRTLFSFAQNPKPNYSVVNNYAKHELYRRYLLN